MVWNRQQSDWPNFQWKASLLEQAEKRFLIGGGMLLGATAHLEPEERSLLTVELRCSTRRRSKARPWTAPASSPPSRGSSACRRMTAVLPSPSRLPLLTALFTALRAGEWPRVPDHSLQA